MEPVQEKSPIEDSKNDSKAASLSQDPSLEAGFSSGSDESKDVPPRDVHGIFWALVVVSTISSMFLFGLDQTITADIQPAIIYTFNSINKLPWVSVALLLGASASNLFWGQIYSNYNAKWAFLVSFVIFELGSLLCGAAPTIDVLIIGRALCGFGGTGMYNGVMTILSVSTSAQERALYMSIPGLAWGSSTVLGPVVGGAFTESSAGWRWGFYINLCVGAVCLPVYLFLVPSTDPRPALSWRSMQRLSSIDMIGFILLCGCFVTLLMGINFGGLLYPWRSGSIIALFVVAGILCIAFWVQQVWAIGTTKQSRSFPLQFLRNPTLMVNFFCQTSSATACFLSIYFIPLYFQFVRQDSALQAAVRLLPYMAFLVATVIGEGLIMSKLHVGKFLPWFFAGGALVLIGGSLMYIVDEDTPTANIYGYTIIMGTGTGAYLQLPFAVAQAKVEPSLIPTAVAFTAFAQLAAPAITLSIATSVFLNRATQSVLAHLPDASPDLVQSIISGTGRDFLDTLGQDVRRQVTGAIVASMSNVYVLVISSGAVTLVATTFLAVYERRPTRKLDSAQNQK